jgi:hypothetical protein
MFINQPATGITSVSMVRLSQIHRNATTFGTNHAASACATSTGDALHERIGRMLGATDRRPTPTLSLLAITSEFDTGIDKGVHSTPQRIRILMEVRTSKNDGLETADQRQHCNFPSWDRHYVVLLTNLLTATVT